MSDYETAFYVSCHLQKCGFLQWTWKQHTVLAQKKGKPQHELCNDLYINLVTIFELFNIV